MNLIQFKQNFQSKYIIIVCQLIFLGIMILSVTELVAKEVKIGVVHTRLPYIVKKTDSGIEIDIIREAFKVRGHKVKFRYLANERASYFLKIGKVDAFLTNKVYDGGEFDINVFHSNVHITYHNHAISLAKNNLKIEKVNDLLGKKVLAFYNAHKYLGTEYALMAERNPQYQEKPDQSIQILWLFTEQVEVIIADKNIFKYHRMLASKKGRFSVVEPVTFHPIFALSPIHGIFRDQEMRDEFNRGLKQIKLSGKYDEIIKSDN